MMAAFYQGSKPAAAAPAFQVPAALLAQQQRGTDVWTKHQRVAAVFGAVLTQWRGGPAGFIGLDYSALEAVRREGGPTLGRGDLQRLQVMEGAALAWLAEQRTKH